MSHSDSPSKRVFLDPSLNLLGSLATTTRGPADSGVSDSFTGTPGDPSTQNCGGQGAIDFDNPGICEYPPDPS